MRVFPPAPAPGTGTPAGVAADVYDRHTDWHRAEERILAHLAIETARRGPLAAARLLFDSEMT